MKIQLDTENKTIKIEETVLLSELTEALEKLLPKGEWKKFTLETNTVIQNWQAPIVIKEYVDKYPYYPWFVTNNTGVDCISGDHLQLNSGTYNVQC